MKKVIILGLILLLIAVFLTARTKFVSKNTYVRPSTTPTKSVTIKKANEPMKITSTAFADQKNIPVKYSCKGEDINPPLQLSDVPENAKSLVLIVDDPDAPMGTFDHWVVYNLSPKVTEIKENTDEIGNQGITSFGKEGYGGPCPPSGTHHYHFKLYALDAILNFSKVPDKKEVEDRMQGHVIAQAELIGLFSK